MTGVARMFHASLSPARLVGMTCRIPNMKLWTRLLLLGAAAASATSTVSCEGGGEARDYASTTVPVESPGGTGPGVVIGAGGTVGAGLPTGTGGTGGFDRGTRRQRRAGRRSERDTSDRRQRRERSAADGAPR